MRVPIFVSIGVRPVIHEGTVNGRPIILIKDSIPQRSRGICKKDVIEGSRFFF
jgi:hypothetical protein